MNLCNIKSLYIFVNGRLALELPYPYVTWYELYRPFLYPFVAYKTPGENLKVKGPDPN
jgi:hypothetical protein